MSEEIPIHQEIADLERQLREKRDQLSVQKDTGTITELPHEKETLHEVVGEKIAESAIPSGLSPAQPQPTTPPPPTINSQTPLSDEMRVQVQELVNLAFTDGPTAAIKKVKMTNNAALIDAFHDLLVDELYNHLIERGKLKQL